MGAAYKTTVCVPQIKDHDHLIRIYYGQTEMGVKDIMRIFGTSQSTAQRLRARAREEMAAMGTPNWNPHMVNVEDAMRSWGVDIARVERATKKLRLCSREEEPPDE